MNSIKQSGYDGLFNKQVIMECSIELNNLSIHDIEKCIIQTLDENKNVKFNQYSLYNKLLGFDQNDITFIDLLKLTDNDKFKKNFLDVLNTIQHKHKNIIVIKNKSIISLILNPTQIYEEKTEKIFKEYKEHDNENFNDGDFNYYKYTIENNNDNNFNYYKYIIENNIDEYLHIDEKGNSIYHNMVNSKFEDYVIELIENNKFDANIKNNFGLTPIDVCENPKIFKLLSLIKINELENKISKYEATENSWILISMFNNIKKYFF